ncbi:TadE/TadG family type IV pilus assembly protein [Sphingomonas floccifaciens]|uniref:TadE/TadG family type IV pilus assembly protein n=1 Tax=Sphingomonas floccifaciens TaxID=1844115 RepID=A0ABW4NHG4_9SPHN
MKNDAFLTDTKGAAALEFAILAPVFLFLIFCLIQFGLVVWTQAAIQHGASAAARCGAVNSSLCGTDEGVRNFAAQSSFGLNPSAQIFHVSQETCGTMVKASLPYAGGATPISLPQFRLTAKACFGRGAAS